MATRRELIAAIGQRYRGSVGDESRRILDEFVRLTGYHRKYAIRVLGPRDGRSRSRASRRAFVLPALRFPMTYSRGGLDAPPTSSRLDCDRGAFAPTPDPTTRGIS